MIRVASSLAVLSLSSQMITFVALPALAVLFSPQDFNSLAGFSSVAMVLITIASLRFDMAIPIVKTDFDAGLLAQLCLLICCMLSLLTAGVLWFILPRISLDPGLARVLPLLPVAVAFGGVQAVFISIVVRRKKLVATGIVRFFQTLAGVGAQVAMGFLGFVVFGLVIGFLVNVFIGALLLFFFTGRGSLGALASLKDLRRVASEQKDYARYSSLDALLNVCSIQAPIFLISIFGEAAAGGFIYMAIRLFYTPSTIISGAFGKIYHASIGEALFNGHADTLTQEVLSHLTKYGGCFVITVIVIGPTVVELLMGPEWAATGQLLFWMAPWILLQMMSSPISTVMLAAKRQREMIFLTAIGFLVRMCLVIGLLFWDPSFAPMGLALGSAIFYGVCMYQFSAHSGLNWRQVTFVIRANWIWWGLCSVACVLAESILHAVA